MENKPSRIKFNPDLESEAGKLYRQYCDEQGIECRITAAANFCLGYMAVKENESTLKAQQGGIVRGTIEDILFKSGKLYQEECTYLADIILQDCSTHYQELKEAKDAAVMFCNKHNVTATELAETVDRAQTLADALKGLLEWHNTALGYGLGRKIEAATAALNAWNGNGQKKEGEDA